MEIEQNTRSQTQTSWLNSSHIKLLIKVGVIFLILLTLTAIQYLISILPNELNKESVLLKTITSNLPKLLHIKENNDTY